MAVFRRLLDAMDAGDLAIMDELCAPRYQYHAAGGGEPLSCAEHKRSIRAFNRSFSEVDHVLHDIFSAQNKVVFRLTGTGVHTGEFLGIPPTGNEVEFRALGVVQFVNGKILHVWIDQDWPALFDQLGTTPPSWHGRWADRLFDPLPPTSTAP